MSTVAKQTAVEILEGKYPEDGWVLAYRYIQLPSRKVGFAVFTSPDFDDMKESPYVMNPICLMANGMLTPEGKALVDAWHRIA